MLKVTRQFKVMVWILFMPLFLYAQDHAFVYIAGGTVGTSVLSSAWTLVGTGLQADFVSGSLNNWTLSSNVLTAGSGAGGTYMVRYALSYAGVATNNWSAGISVGGATPAVAVSQRTVVSSTKDTGTISGSAIIAVSEGQTISLRVKPTTNGTFKPIDAQITLVEVTENSSSTYGGMIISSDKSQTPGTSFVTLTGFSASADLSDWTFASNELTAGSSAAGTYLAIFSSTFTGVGAVGSPATYTQGIVKNGASNNPIAIKSKVKANATDRQHTTACGILSILVGDKVRIEILTATGSKALTTRYASVQLYKISGSTAPSLGQMTIATDQTISILALDTWYTVGTFSIGSTNEWGFSSNTLIPTTGSDAAGLYRLDYSLSFTSPTADDRYSISVFVGANRKLGSMSQRKIRTSGYFGTVSASVPVNIASVDSSITLRVRKDIGTIGNNLTVKKADLSLFSIIPLAHDGSLPVELSSFKSLNNRGSVKLYWLTDSEIENQGFIIERTLRQACAERSRSTQGPNLAWTEIASFSKNRELLGQGSTTAQTEYYFTDKQVKVGESYSYRLSDVDYQARITNHDAISVTVLAKDENTKPGKLVLNKAYPNPFNPNVTLSFDLDIAIDAVSLQIYDLNGVLVQTISSGSYRAGNHKFSWQGTDKSGKPLSSGIYIVRLAAEGQAQIQRVTLLR